jgi:hypothetical protein
VLVEGEVRHEPFESGIFFFHLSQPPEFAHAQMRILLFSGVEGEFTDADLSPEIANRGSLSVCRMAYTICFSENHNRFIALPLSSSTAEAVVVL